MATVLRFAIDLFPIWSSLGCLGMAVDRQRPIPLGLPEECCSLELQPPRKHSLNGLFQGRTIAS